MQNKFFFLLQALIICNRYIFSTALVGDKIRTAKRSEFPAAVALAEFDLNLSLEENIFCTGVFISSNHILTYDQCFDYIEQRNFKVIAENPTVLRGTEFDVAWWTTYGKWADYLNIQKAFNESNIAMLKIQGMTSDNMRPSPISPITPLNMFVGLIIQIVGFGESNLIPTATTLKTANVEVLSMAQCELQLSQIAGTRLKLDPRFICTSGNPPVLLTRGDSGGPLYHEGTLVAINTMVLTDVVPKDHPKRVNIHVGLDWYRNFINFNLRF